MDTKEILKARAACARQSFEAARVVWSIASANDAHDPKLRHLIEVLYTSARNIQCTALTLPDIKIAVFPESEAQ